MRPSTEHRAPSTEHRAPSDSAASRVSCERSASRSLAWLLALAFSGLCLAATNSARGQLVPPDTAYEWSDDAGSADATDAANWHSPDGTVTLPPEDAHLVFGNRPA